jgi:hypothetical protein
MGIQQTKNNVIKQGFQNFHLKKLDKVIDENLLTR